MCSYPQVRPAAGGHCHMQLAMVSFFSDQMHTHSMSTHNKSPFLQFTSSAPDPTQPSQLALPIFIYNDAQMFERLRKLDVFGPNRPPLSDDEKRHIAAMLALHSHIAREAESYSLVDAHTDLWLVRQLQLPILQDEEAAIILPTLGFVASDTGLEPGRMRIGHHWLKAPNLLWYCDHDLEQQVRSRIERKLSGESRLLRPRDPFRYVASYIAEMTHVTT